MGQLLETGGAIGLWLVFGFCPAVFAADGAQAAAAAKEAAGRFKAYLGDLEKSKGKPDYAKPPASEYLKRIFDADALAALPAPKTGNFDWLLEWVTSVDQTFIAMLMFGAKDPIDQPAGRNLVDYQDNTLPAAAFKCASMPTRQARCRHILIRYRPVSAHRREARLNKVIVAWCRWRRAWPDS